MQRKSLQIRIYRPGCPGGQLARTACVIVISLTRPVSLLRQKKLEYEQLFVTGHNQDA